MLDSIIYAAEDLLTSAPAKRIGKSCSGVLDFGDEFVGLGTDGLRSIRKTIKDNDKPLTPIQQKIANATDNAKRINGLKREALRAGLALEDFLSEAELKEIGIIKGK